MEYDLYIAGRQADLDEKIKIALNYTAIDTEEPTAEHGSFSKSVELPGTANNNEIFGQMYDVSRAILGDDPEAGGVYFDPRKRTPYVLYYNGDVNDRGYIKVDSISNTDGDISYSCTLYSDLGDFFYNLCYNEDGEELNLGDLHYGFTDYSGNTIDEDGILCKWDKDYISGGWDKIRNVFNDPTDRTVNNFLVAAPTYGGYYDDFDNDKVLVNYSSITSGSTAYRLLQPVINADSAYTPYKGWILCEATRDLDEWEARDLRSTYQRPAVKMSLILDAISDPENNGGYEVIWDDSIKNSPYYTHTFLLMNRLNFDNDPQANGLLQLNGDASTRITSTPWNKWYEMTMSTTSGSTLDLSGYKEPRMTMSLNNAFSATVAREGQTIYTSYFTKYYPIYTEDYYKTAYVYGGMVVRADVYVNGTLHSSTPNYLISTDVYNSKKGFGYEVDDWKQQIGTQLGIDPDTIVLKINNLSWNNGDVVWDKDIRFALDLPNVSGVQVKFNVAWSWARSKSNVSACAAFQSDDRVKGWLTGTILGSTMLFNYENGDGYDTGIFDGTINPALQKSNVTKRVLFSETETPYKYLVGFTRMLGAKYKYDLGAKKIYIMPRNKYYLPYGHMIDEWIDRGQKMEVQPTLSEYKWYNYGFETPETYAAQLYNRRNKTEYGVKKVDTGYYFNNDTNNLFEDIPYTNGIPYLQQSIYYNVAVGVPQILLSPTFKGTVFCESGGTIETKETTAYGYSSSHSLSVRKDMSGDKICCFDDGNDPVEDVTNCLVFYDGFADIGNTYQISDNLPIMGTLNENPCFMALTGYTAIADADSDTPVEVKKEVIGVPRFSKYLRNLDNVYVDSLDFMKPAYTFIDNYDNYQDGICIYDRYWRAFIEDLYERNAKAVTVKMFLKEKPDVAMRKFYFFDNSIWVISEITDYDASSDEPTQVKFVKVYDTSDYTDGEIAWDDYYRVPGTIDPDSGGGSGGDEPSATTYEYRWVQDSSSGCSGYTQCYYYKKQQRPSGTTQAWVDVYPPVISMNGDGTMFPVPIAYSSVTCGYGACNCVDKNIRLWGKGWYGNSIYFSGGTLPAGYFDDGLINSIEFCGGITAIEDDNFNNFYEYGDLDRVVIGAGVTRIGNNCFNGNSGLREITSLAMTAPSLGTHVFSDLETRWGTRYFYSAGTLYYPQGATGYDVWLNRLPSGWTGVEMSGATYVYDWFVNDNLSGCSGTTKYKLYQKYERNVACGSPYRTAVVPTVTSIDADGTKTPIVLETGSTDCGYVPPQPYSGSTEGEVSGCTGGKVHLTLTGGTHEWWCFPSGEIPNSKFRQRTDIANIEILSGITEIYEYAFADCYSAATITIDSDVATIGGRAFGFCWNLTSITIFTTTAPTIAFNTFDHIASGGTLYYPCGSDYSTWLSNSQYYLGYYGWSGACACSEVQKYSIYSVPHWSTDTYPDSIIPDRKYYSKTGFSQVIIDVQTIGDDAFNDSEVARVTFTDCVTTIGNRAFSDCFLYSSLTIGNRVRTIGDEAFYKNSSISSVTISDSVISIGSKAFAGYHYLEYIKIGNNVRTIGAGAFSPNIASSITIPNSVTTIGTGAFNNSFYLKSITIPDSVTSMGESAFNKCHSATTITIGSGLTSISNSAFTACNSLTSLTMPDTITSIGSYAFSGGHKVRELSIPNRVTSIGEMAFSGWELLSSITIPDSVQSLGSHTFLECRALTTVNIGSGLTSIYTETFYGCSNLREIWITAPIAPTIIMSFPPNSGMSAGQYGTLHYPCGSDYSTWLEALNYNSNRSWVGVCFNPSGVTYEYQWVQDASSGCSGYTQCQYYKKQQRVAGSSDPWVDCYPPVYSFDGDGTMQPIVIAYSSTTCGYPTPTPPYSGTTEGEVSGCTGGKVHLTLTGGTHEWWCFPDGVIPLDQYARRTDIASAEVLTGITEIQVNAFGSGGGEWNWSDTAMTAISISSTVEKIGSLFIISSQSDNWCGNIIWACRDMSSITVDTGNTYYDSRNNCNAIITTVDNYDENGRGYPANTLLQGCKSTVIPNTVKRIGAAAFFRSKLTSVTIPDSVEIIGELAFQECYRLSSVTIGSGVTSIYQYAFVDCGNLSSITCYATTAPEIRMSSDSADAHHTVFKNLPTGGTLYVPSGSTGYSVWLDALPSGWSISYI